MSSPSININNGSSSAYPSLEAIMNLVRALVNDSQAGATGDPGEGQILTDNPAISPFTQPFLNSSIREVYRELRNVGQPTLIKDNILIIGVTPMDSPTYGLGSEDPSVQVNIGFGGYFDGVQMWPNLALPDDVIYPERVWERQNGSNLPFGPMCQSTFGLPSRPQGVRMSEWEWRGDAIWMVGAIQTVDLRLRYYANFPTFFSDTLDFNTTFVPIMDSLDAIAYKTAVKYAGMLGSPGLADIKMDAKEQMFQLKNANTRRMQSENYMRIPYGSYGDGRDSGGFFPGQQ